MWVARDEGAKRCYLFAHKPKRWTYFWSDGKSDNKILLDGDMFPNLKWEDDPIEVNLVIVKEE